MVGEKVLLRVLPIKSVMIFGKKGTLIPRFIGPFKLLERVGEVAYRLALPPSLLPPSVHVYMLQKYHEEESHILDFITVQLDENMAYEEEPVAILDRQVRRYDSKPVR
ncbi:PREDICTED: uncharacterized protein LOC109206549 [Nicotiana attenuata]|uniref:uncharacterized protein LOC109206549 n=1 Tax=Nicotiana attenuata TaxID=49451 RepID=UPI00090497F9|nr:PREDICTED: uncharacterized protein LOC109206549 [Nicotiana attenuata]